jgi:hypothetical protein
MLLLPYCYDVLLLLCCCPTHQADEELREGKLRFRGGRGEAATYDEGDEVRKARDGVHCTAGALLSHCITYICICPFAIRRCSHVSAACARDTCRSDPRVNWYVLG